MKWRIVVSLGVLAMLLSIGAGSAWAGDPNSCVGLPNPELTMTCFEKLHPEPGITSDPQGWLAREPFLTPLANLLAAEGWSVTPTRLANVFASWKYERGYWRHVLYGDESAAMVAWRDALAYANDEEAFRNLFDVGDQVFAVNRWPPTYRYTYQFCNADLLGKAACW
jgi:hypothetical protein